MIFVFLDLSVGHTHSWMCAVLLHFANQLIFGERERHPTGVYFLNQVNVESLIYN